MDWRTIEMLGYTHYAHKGYRILVPIADGRDYDFVAEKDGTFLRVNVKMAGIKDRARSNSWSIALSSGSGSRVHLGTEVDVYLAYVVPMKKFIELPGTFFVGSKSKSRCIPVKLLALPTTDMV